MILGDDRSSWSRHVIEALGDDRVSAIQELATRVARLRELSVDVRTAELFLIPLTGQKARAWERLAALRGEDWVFVASHDGASVLALDEPSADAGPDAAAAVIYPELHQRSQAAGGNWPMTYGSRQ